jgi:hypothetical protein
MYRIAVVAHTSRQEQANRLTQQINADYLTTDDGTLGARGNHLHAWKWLADNNTQPWSLVLEDDAQPVDDFHNQLEATINARPNHNGQPINILSLYLGTGHPRTKQPHIKKAITKAQTADAHWIIDADTNHAVALAIHTPLLPDMLNTLHRTRWEIDRAISQWARRKHHRIAYTYPSLVDHRDDPPTTTHNRTHTRPRKAWTLGTRNTWNNNSIHL